MLANSAVPSLFVTIFLRIRFNFSEIPSLMTLFLFLMISSSLLIKVGLISKPPFVIIEYPFASCNGVVVIPCPKETVANLHFPHLNGYGSPTSSISKSILFKTPTFSKKDLSFSISNFCPILTDPIFPDLIKISSTVKSEGILSLYSPIG